MKRPNYITLRSLMSGFFAFAFMIASAFFILTSSHAFAQSAETHEVKRAWTDEEIIDLGYIPDEVVIKFKKDRIDLKTESGRAKTKVFIEENTATLSMKVLKSMEKIVQKAERLSKINPKQLEKLEEKFLEQSDELKFANTIVLKLGIDDGVMETVEELMSDPNVESAFPNWVFEFLSTPDDDQYADQWALGQNYLNTEEAWEITTGNKNVVVAVIDTGVAYNHPDLMNNMWEPDDSCRDYENSVLVNGCPNHGWDYGDGEEGEEYPEDYPYGDNDPNDYDGHGTHVAGIIGATVNDDGVVGVNWNVSIMAVKIGTRYGTYINAQKAIQFAENNGADIINASWGHTTENDEYSDGEIILRNAIKNFTGIFVAATGNDNINNDNGVLHSYPDSYTLDNIISTTATNTDDEINQNWGAVSVDIAAPGTDILSTHINDRGMVILTGNFNNQPPEEGENTWHTEIIEETIDDYTLEIDYLATGYSHDADFSTISTNTFDLTGKNPDSVRFEAMKARCDTELTSESKTEYPDYVEIWAIEEGTSNGGVIATIHEGIFSKDSGDGKEDDIYAYIPPEYQYANTQIKLRWVTDNDNEDGEEYEGCRIGLMQIKYLEDGEAGEGNSHTYKSGTSMAAPFVSGVVALIKAKYPDLSNYEIKQIIMESGDDISAKNPNKPTVSNKRLNAHRVLLLADIYNESGIRVNEGETEIEQDGTADFGSAVIGEPVTQTFTIKNSGTENLELYGSPIVQLSGDNADEFEIVSQPVLSDIGILEETQFTVRFNSLSAGAKNAVLSFVTNRAGYNPFVINLIGVGEESGWIPPAEEAHVSPTIHSTIAGGNWNNEETWEEGRIPNANDQVQLDGGVVLNVDTSINGLLVSETGALVVTWGDRTLTINGDVINSNRIQKYGSHNLNLNINGNFKNTGSLLATTNVSGDIKNEGNIENSLETWGTLENNGTIENSTINSRGDLINNGSILSGYLYVWGHIENNSSIGGQSYGVELRGDQPHIITGTEQLQRLFIGENSIIGNDVSIKSIWIPTDKSLTVLDGYALTINGQINVAGTLNAENVIIENSYIYEGQGVFNVDQILFKASVSFWQNMTINGNLEVAAGTVIKPQSYSKTITVSGNVINNGKFDYNNYPNGVELNIKGNLINNGSIFDSIYLSGNIENNGTTPNGNTEALYLQGDDPHIISGTEPVGKIYVDEDVIIASDLEVNDLYIPADKILTVSDNYTLKINGGVAVSGTVNSKNVIIENGYMSHPSTFNADNITFVGQVALFGKNIIINGNLEIANDVTVKPSGANYMLTVNGDVINHGIFEGQWFGGSYGDYRYVNLEVGGNLKNDGDIRSAIYLSGNMENNGTMTNSQTNITWSTVTDATYDLQITDPQLNWQDTVSLTENQYNITSMVSQTRWWKVRPVVAGTPGDWSEVHTINSVYIPPMEIHVKNGETDIESGGSYDFENVETGNEKEVIFTIINQGDGELEITGATLTGDNAFEITQMPGPVLLPDGETEIKVRFTSEIVEEKTAQLTINSNDDDEGQYILNLSATGVDTTPPLLTEITTIPAETGDTTPDWTFSSTEAGIISYGGACASSATNAVSGNNTITLNELAEDWYTDCTVIVTDEAGNTSEVLDVSDFRVVNDELLILNDAIDANIEEIRNNAATNPGEGSDIVTENAYDKFNDNIAKDKYKQAAINLRQYIEFGGTEYREMIYALGQYMTQEEIKTILKFNL